MNGYLATAALVFLGSQVCVAADPPNSVRIQPDDDGWYWSPIDANHLLVGGTLVYVGDKDLIDDPINLHQIDCDKTTLSCEQHVAKIFDNRELTMSTSYWRISSWTAVEIYADPIINDSCRTTKMRINLKTHSVTFTVTPGLNGNETIELCEKLHMFPTRVYMMKLAAPADAMKADPRTK